jgi:hypothetical protein
MTPEPAKKVLLVVHHTTSPATQTLLEAALNGTKADGIEGVEVRARPALAATTVDVLEADGFLLGTPANIGYMSGALKTFFDLVYYPTLIAKVSAPYGLYVHGNNDTEGAIRAAEWITKGFATVRRVVSIRERTRVFVWAGEVCRVGAGGSGASADGAALVPGDRMPAPCVVSCLGHDLG